MFRCTRCNVGQNHCPHCTARLCIEHMPLGDDPCAECELAYQVSRGNRGRLTWLLVGLVLPWITFVGLLDHFPSWSARSGGIRAITTGVPMLDIIITFSVTSIFAAKGALGLRELAQRRAFLASRAPAR